MEELPATVAAALRQTVTAQDETELEREVGRLYESLWLPLCRYLVGMAGSGDAEDVAQEAFLRYYRERLKGTAVDSSRAWLFRTAHNLAVDRLRQVTWTDPVPSCSQPADAERSLMDQERGQRLRCGLRLLSVQERACLELRCEGLRYREIAETLGVKLPTVVTCITRAVTKLKKVLA